MSRSVVWVRNSRSLASNQPTTPTCSSPLQRCRQKRGLFRKIISSAARILSTEKYLVWLSRGTTRVPWAAGWGNKIPVCLGKHPLTEFTPKLFPDPLFPAQSAPKKTPIVSKGSEWLQWRRSRVTRILREASLVVILSYFQFKNKVRKMSHIICWNWAASLRP